MILITANCMYIHVCACTCTPLHVHVYYCSIYTVHVLASTIAPHLNPSLTEPNII